MKPLGKPVNNQHKECDAEINSSCVIWDGPNISAECLGIQICQGDSITPIIYNTFKNFCNFLEASNIKGIDSSCIFELASPPDTIPELINLIISKVCDQNIRINTLENKAELAYSANLPYCLQIASDTITVTKLPLDEYMEVLSLKLCEEIQQIEPLKDEFVAGSPLLTNIEDFTVAINNQCAQVVAPVTQFCLSPNTQFQVTAGIIPVNGVVQYFTSIPHDFAIGDLVNVTGMTPDLYNVTLQEIISISANSFVISNLSAIFPGPVGNPGPFGAFAVEANSIPIEEAYEKLEKAFCSFKNFTGTPQELQNAIARDCPNLSNLPSLSNTGLMKDIYGWIENPINVGQSLNNLWLVLCDMRSAIRNILRNCCFNSPCFSFDVGFYVNPSSTSVELVFQQAYTPPFPYLPYNLSNIFDLSRLQPLYASGALPSWFSYNYPDITTVTLTLSDGTNTFIEDTNLTPMQLMSLPLGTGYVLNYPAGFDTTAPIKSVTASFDYSYTNLVTNVTSVGNQVTYTLAKDHFFQVNDRVDIYGVIPAGYNLTNALVVGIPASNQVTIVSPFFGVAYVSDGGVILSYKPGTSERDCERGKCCCTFSLTNGIY